MFFLLLSCTKLEKHKIRRDTIMHITHQYIATLLPVITATIPIVMRQFISTQG